MIARYQQDLAPFFERIRAEKHARRGAWSRSWHAGWSSLVALLRPASRRG